MSESFLMPYACTGAPQLQDLVVLAAQICGTPVALVSILDGDNPQPSASVGVEGLASAPSPRFCQQALRGGGFLEVRDVTRDARFSDVAGSVRFYAGLPLDGRDGKRLGTLCVMDTQPRELTDVQRDALTRLAREAKLYLEHEVERRQAIARERALAALLESMPDAVVSCDERGLLGEFNSQARAWHGVRERALPPEQWSNYFDLYEDDGVTPLPTARIPLWRAWQGEHVRDAEIVIRPAGQPPRPVLCNGEPIRDRNGRPLGAVVVMRDVSEARRIHAELAEQQRRLNAIIDGTRAGTWEWNVQTGETRFNERWARIVGYELRELAPISIETWTRLAHPDDLELSRQQLERHFRGELSEYDVCCRMRHRDGRWIWVQDRGRVYEWDANGQPLWMAGSHLDVTAEREAELANTQVRQQLQAVIDASVNVAIIATDTSGTVLVFNPGAERLLGYPREAVVGRCTLVRFHLDREIEQRARAIGLAGDGPVARFRALVAGATAGVPDTRQWTFVRADGKHRQVQLSVTLMPATGGVPGGYVCMAIDITDRLLAEEALRLEVQRFSGAFAAAAQGMALVSLEGRWMEVNDAMCSMLGYTRAELTALDFQSITHPDDLAPDLQLAQELLAGTRANYQLAKRYIGKHGQVIHVILSGSVVRDVEGAPLYFIAQVMDTTEQHRAVQALQDSEERLRVTLQSIGDAVLTADVRGNVQFANPVAARMLGLPQEAVIGRPLRSVFRLCDERTSEPVADHIEACTDDLAHSDDTVLVRPDGSRVHVRETVAPLHSRDGQPTGLVIVFRDNTVERAQKQRYAHLAAHDELTGLPNRRAFEAQLSALLDGSDRHHVLLFIDLDRFKAVNDTAGHLAGDELLRVEAGVLERAVRASDLVARFGGDEFGVLLRDSTVVQVQPIADELRRAVAELRFVWEGREFRIGASIGAVEFSGVHERRDVLRIADEACYQAKRSGGGVAVERIGR